MLLLVLIYVAFGNSNFILIRLNSDQNELKTDSENRGSDIRQDSDYDQDYNYNPDESNYQDYKGYDDYFGTPEKVRKESIESNDCPDQELETPNHAAGWNDTWIERKERRWAINYDKFSSHAKKMKMGIDKGTCQQRNFMGDFNGGFISRVSTVFMGTGNAEISFGNCNNIGETRMFLNNVEIGKAGPQSESNPGTFSYKVRDTLHIEGKEGGIISIDSIKIKCKDRKVSDSPTTLTSTPGTSYTKCEETLASNGYNTIRDLCKSSGNPSSSNCNDLQDCCGESFMTATATNIKQSFSTLKTSTAQSNLPNIHGFRKFHFGIEPKSNSCNKTVEECITTCENPKLEVETTNNTCSRLCCRCMGESWRSTQLAGGAFGSLTECFQHFSGKFKPDQLFSNNENCSTSFVVS